MRFFLSLEWRKNKKYIFWSCELLFAIMLSLKIEQTATITGNNNNNNNNNGNGNDNNNVGGDPKIIAFILVNIIFSSSFLHWREKFGQ